MCILQYAFLSGADGSVCVAGNDGSGRNGMPGIVGVGLVVAGIDDETKGWLTKDGQD